MHTLDMLNPAAVRCCPAPAALGLRDFLSALPGLEELQLGSCRSISRAARQAAAAGVEQLKRYLQEAD